jgi:hypothetical protein
VGQLDSSPVQPSTSAVSPAARYSVWGPPGGFTTSTGQLPRHRVGDSSLLEDWGVTFHLV